MGKTSVVILAAISFLITFFVLERPKFSDNNDGKLHIYFFDVGQGDASLIKLPSKKLILIDGGPGSSVVEQISEEVPFNTYKIDLVVVSHSHADHISGLIDILENYEIGCMVYDMQDRPVSETEEHLRGQISLKGIKVVPSGNLSEDCFSDPHVKLEIYSLRSIGEESQLDSKYQNFESNIVMLDYQDFEALFTGDAEIPVQIELLEYLNADIEVIKSAHHGSENGFYIDLFEKLAPDFAIISVGKDNSYGHPDREVTDGYSQMNLNYARTDLDGTVEIQTDGHNWDIFTENRVE